MLYRIVFILFFMIFNANIYSYYFKFLDIKGDQYRIVTSSIQTAYIDNRKRAVFEHGYKANLRVVDVQNNAAKIEGKYYYMAKPYGVKESYKIVEDRIYETEFVRFPNGKIEIDTKYFYPVIRNLPLFPDKDIAIGETWEGNGYESQDFRNLGLEKPFITPFNVSYQYIKDEIRNGKNYAVVKIFYYMNNKFSKPMENIYLKARFAVPIRVMGYFKGNMFWDKETNQFTYYDGEYNFIYIMSNGEIREWEGKEDGEVTLIRENKENEIKIKEEAKKQIGEVAEIKDDKEGIKLIFSDILFDFNKTNLKPEVISTLDKVIDILNKYPQYEVRVEGHSDNIGQEEFKTAIAENRAKSVANYFVKKGIDDKRISYSGFSDTKPLLPNTSDENRAKNRRVEIYIITK